MRGEKNVPRIQNSRPGFPRLPGRPQRDVVRFYGEFSTTLLSWRIIHRRELLQKGHKARLLSALTVRSNALLQKGLANLSVSASTKRTAGCFDLDA